MAIKLHSLPVSVQHLMQLAGEMVVVDVLKIHLISCLYHQTLVLVQ
jgi:hypothetical protein